jgi:hypothetical protein
MVLFLTQALSPCCQCCLHSAAATQQLPQSFRLLALLLLLILVLVLWLIMLSADAAYLEELRQALSLLPLLLALCRCYHRCHSAAVCSPAAAADDDDDPGPGPGPGPNPAALLQSPQQVMLLLMLLFLRHALSLLPLLQPLCLATTTAAACQRCFCCC